MRAHVREEARAHGHSFTPRGAFTARGQIESRSGTEARHRPMQCLHAALLAFSAPLASLQLRAARGAVSASALNDDWATPLEVATKKSMRQVATYRASMEAEVVSLSPLTS